MPTARLHIGYVDDSKKFREGFKRAQAYLNGIGFYITSECMPTIESLLLAYDYNTHTGPTTAPVASITQPELTLQEGTPPFGLIYTDYHIPTLYQARHWGGRLAGANDEERDANLSQVLRNQMEYIPQLGSQFSLYEPDSEGDPYGHPVDLLASKHMVDMMLEKGEPDDPHVRHFREHPVPKDGWVVRDVLGTDAIEALRRMEKHEGMKLPPIVGFSGKKREWDVDFDVQKYSDGIMVSMLLPILHLVAEGHLPRNVLPPRMNYEAIAREAVAQAEIQRTIPDDIIREKGTVVEAAGKHKYADPEWVKKHMPEGDYAGQGGAIDPVKVITALLKKPDIMVAQRKEREPLLEAERFGTFEPAIKRVVSKNPPISWP